MARSLPQEPFRSFDPAEAIAPLADPVEQWLEWEEQANLVGFRISTHPVELEVASIPRAALELRVSPDAPTDLMARFLDADRVRFPRHPLNQDPGIAHWNEPAVEQWTARFTSSRTLVIPAAAHGPLCSVKLATDHPHPDFHQPEKTKLREEATDAMRWVELLARVDAVLGPDPQTLIVREVMVVLVPGTETGFLVRDLRGFQDGHYYLPALSIPWVGRQLSRLHGADFDTFWGLHYAEAVGRAKARFLVRTGLQFETPNPQNLLVQLDGRLAPTGCIVIRDLGDADCATDALACEAADRPWTRLVAELRPETDNSFWAFDEAGAHSVDAATLDTWRARHDRAYFLELADAFPALAPVDVAGSAAALRDWSRVLREPTSERTIAEAFCARHVRAVGSR